MLILRQPGARRRARQLPRMRSDKTMTTVYLLHFDRPIGTTGKGAAQHYLGSTENLKRRLHRHRTGYSGSCIVRAFHALGIGFVVARTWEDPDRSRERNMKRNHHIGRACPICREIAKAK